MKSIEQQNHNDGNPQNDFSVNADAQDRKSQRTFSLEELGLGLHFQTEERENGQLLGRVIARKAMRYDVATRFGILEAEVAGKLSYMAESESDLPVVGDWVYGVWDGPDKKAGPIGLGLILEVLPRRGVLARRQVERSDAAQIMAANVDTLFVMWSLDRIDTESASGELKARWGGVQRFLTLAKAGGIGAVVVFSKADLLPQETQLELRARAKELWPDIPVFLTGGLGEGGQHQIRQESSPEGNGELGQSPVGYAPLDDIPALAALMPFASTNVLVGLSGAGKSSLANALRGNDHIKTGSVRADDVRGRHTTTHRELYATHNGALIIDSPGIREIGIWGDEDDVNESFSDIAALAGSCRFSDCRHEDEPGCAVRAAIAEGILPEATFIQYRKQISEIRKAEARNIRSGKVEATSKQIYEAGGEKRRWMAIHKSMKNFSKENRSRNG